MTNIPDLFIQCCIIGFVQHALKLYVQWWKEMKCLFYSFELDKTFIGYV